MNVTVNENESTFDFNQIESLIRSAAFVIVGAGAGMSADSGIQTYQQVDDSEFLTTRNLSYRDVSSIDLLAKNPALFAEWAERCIEKFRASEPHNGYALLNQLQQYMSNDSRNAELCAALHGAMRNGARSAELDATRMPGRMLVVTTNVDSMFRRAGLHDVVELHGAYERWQCSALCLPEDNAPPYAKFGKVCTKQTWQLDSAWQPTGALPPCRHCAKRPARPAVYNFGDSHFVGDAVDEANLVCFVEAVRALQLPVVLLEIGVGQRLPRIRRIFGDLHSDAVMHIRLNPDEREPDEPGVVRVRANAVDALTQMLSFLH
jgi:NAD-dependent SIR2 family protein deacetylase